MAEKNNETIIVNGFAFSDETEAQQAKKEQEGIAYISGKLDMNHPQMVLEIYNKMVEEALFETIIGEMYLKELRDYLVTIPYLNQEEILPVPVIHRQASGEVSKPAVRKPAAKKQPKQEPKQNVHGWEWRAKLMTGISIALAVCVIAMFAIQMSVGSPNILNYENKIIDKYAQWEQQLEEREAAVREREKQAGSFGQEE